MYNNCEMIEYNLCLGCTGLAEKDWIGKYKCKEYNKLKDSKEYKEIIRKRGNNDVYSRINIRRNFRCGLNGNIAKQ